MQTLIVPWNTYGLIVSSHYQYISNQTVYCDKLQVSVDYININTDIRMIYKIIFEISQ